MLRANFDRHRRILRKEMHDLALSHLNLKAPVLLLEESTAIRICVFIAEVNEVERATILRLL